MAFLTPLAATLAEGAAVGAVGEAAAAGGAAAAAPRAGSFVKGALEKGKTAMEAYQPHEQQPPGSAPGTTDAGGPGASVNAPNPVRYS